MQCFTTRSLCTTLLFCALLIVICAALSAQSFSHLVSFQGRLADPDTGKPLPDGQYEVTFTIYDAETEGNNLWQETQDAAQTGGVFCVHLGSLTPFPSDVFTSGDRWLGIKVGEDAEMPERFRFTPNPWAIYAASAAQAVEAEHAAQADHAASADTAAHAQDADTVNGYGASGTPNPYMLLALDGEAKWPASTMPEHDHWGETWTGEGVGLTLISTGPGDRGDSIGFSAEGENAGVYGKSGSGYGVFGESGSGTAVRGTSETGNGVSGTSQGPGIGVSGSSETGKGVEGYSRTGPGVEGLSITGVAVKGKSTSGAGLYGESTEAAGVYGRSTNWIGVEAESDDGWPAVRGINNGDSAGVVGICDHPNGFGVIGYSWDGTAVRGESRNGSGIVGESTYGGGVSGISQEGVGVSGQSTNGEGVWGGSETGTGVEGASIEGAGVEGWSVNGDGVRGMSLNGIGVYAASDNGTALYVDGTSEFHCEATFHCDVHMLGELHVGKLWAEEIDPIIVELFRVNPSTVYEPGDVLVIDPESDACKLCDSPDDTKVACVVWRAAPNQSGEVAGVILGANAGSKCVCIKVDAAYAPIERGDMLTTSATLGHAMKATDPKLGSIIGKAMEPMEEGTGLIKAFVTLR